MSHNDVSIATYANENDAKANAQVMRKNGFKFVEVPEGSDSANWNNFTVKSNILDDAKTPAWVVIGKR